MKFTFVRRSGLPKLAWCMESKFHSSTLTVFHGDWVETNERSFVEGSWASDYSIASFDDSFMTGTGARLKESSVVVVAPSHTLDRLVVLRKGRLVYVSNSLPFVLAISGESLDTGFLFYDSYIASIRHGLDRFERLIPTKAGLSISLYYSCNIELNPQHELIEIRKTPSPRFANYTEYRAHLGGVIARIVRNASDQRRRIRYLPITTVSKGYDSVAATVLAKQVGCNEALVFRESRHTVRDEDSGTEIADLLGYDVREFGRLDYRQRSDFPEAASSGGPTEFLSFGDCLRGRLLFTGFNGDMVWNKNSETVSADLVRTDASGTSLTEFRLETGFCHLPVPFIGADRHPSIYAISNSAEMLPWSVGGSYDRPIARRIVEEAGVSRDTFGQKKRAAGVVVSVEGLAGTMSERSMDDFEGFVRSNWSVSKTLKCAWMQFVKRIVHLNERARKVGARLKRTLRLRYLHVPFLVPHRYVMLSFGYVGKESLLFHWGVGKLVSRYQSAMRNLPL